MSDDWKSRLNMVYSTNPDFEYGEVEQEPKESVPKEKQLIRIALDKKQRRGKQVTIIADFRGTEQELKELGKMLKTKCGVGGSAKDGEIIIQGDFREKIKQILHDNGYSKSRTI